MSKIINSYPQLGGTTKVIIQYKYAYLGEVVNLHCAFNPDIMPLLWEGNIVAVFRVKQPNLLINKNGKLCSNSFNAF